MKDLYTGMEGFVTELAGAFTTKLGYDQAAEAYRIQGAAYVAQAGYNVALDKYNTSRQLNQFNRTQRSLMSTQRAAMGASGAAFTSKTFMTLANDTLDAANRQRIDIINTANQRQEMMQYEAALQQWSFDQKAQAAEQKGITSFLGSLGSIFDSGTNVVNQLYTLGSTK